MRDQVGELCGPRGAVYNTFLPQETLLRQYGGDVKLALQALKAESFSIAEIEPKLHWHRAANRVMVKELVADFWRAHRLAEGLPVVPRYSDRFRAAAE